ncbi:MAG: 2-oxoglutarate and iron-dependent oxygenase domain-containing protein [Roseobacter sp.]|jgi:isopenicillin N synthase-like dioxygenase|nr:2-oxoglutarate and iron-dependent oxygenase domain-containing protein [Roseobacter sp.]
MNVPILDFTRFSSGNDRDRFVRELGSAFRDSGFFLLRGHGVDAALISAVFAQADAFFDLPLQDKQKLDIRQNGQNRGWVSEGSETLDETSGQIDLKEAFNIGLDLVADDPRILAGEPFRNTNIWPDLPMFRETLLRYFAAVHSLGVSLHRPIALDLGLPSTYFDAYLDEPMATLRLLRYPPSDPAKSIGAGAHTDYGSITLLMTDGEPGLQIKPRGGVWMDAPHVPDAFVVNIGDCLMRWTNDVYVSTPHRVSAPKRKRRSIAFFLDPNPDALIAALPGTGEALYPAVLASDYLRSRLDATYRKES